MNENQISILQEWVKFDLERDISSDQIQQFQIYLELLQEWNKKINLTAIMETQDIIEKHFIDSLTCLKIPIFFYGISLLDIGTGAGFPGIPIKILRPDLKLLLIETVGKKAEFLDHLIREIKLKEIDILKERAEILAHQPDFREKLDIVISRALAKLPVASEICLPFVKRHGFYLAMLGEDAKEQIESAKFAISELGGSVKILKELISNRYIGWIEKINPSPDKYPRKSGIPAKRPLLDKK